MSDSPALTLANISKQFGAVHALDDVSLDVAPGAIHAVLGENGAGKSTLMRIAYGLLSPDHGTIRVNGRVIAFRSARDAIDSGIGMVHQHFSQVPTMTVAENVALGGHGRYSMAHAADQVRRVAEEAGLSLDPEARAEDLSVSAQQRLEIVKALAGRARVLILDEPTSVLAPPEAAELLAWLRRFSDSGAAVVLVTHKVREALAVADTVTVLRRGRMTGTAPAATYSVASLARTMFPDAPTDIQVSRPTTPISRSSKPLVVADHITIQDDNGRARIVDASFAVNAGDILGVAGVDGAGHAYLLRALAGVCRIAQGELHVPTDVGFVPEDRHRDALALDFSLTENLALHGAGNRAGLMSWRGFEQRTRDLMAAFDVRAGSEHVTARTLSGGNQQKFVLGRELEQRPSLLVAENPTRGLDLQATADVQARLRAAADGGAAVVVYSSDLDELLSVATHMLVVHNARVREVPLDRDRIGQAMLGAT